MIKNNKGLMIITSIIILLPIAIGLYFWNELPDMMATHWNVHNQPDGYFSKTMAVIGMPLILCALHWLCAFLTGRDPKRPEYSKKMVYLILLIIPFVSLLSAGLTYSHALGFELNVGFWTLLFLGVLFAVVGNYLPKCRQSWFVGIKLPWTLEDADNWNRTHRLAGPIWVVGGLIIALTSPLASPWIAGPILLIMVFVPTIYSYLIYKQKQ